MSEASQIIAWTKGSFDGIEREHRPDDQGSHFVTIGVTRSSLRAYHRALGGKIDWYRDEIAKLR